jgi:hypothetical protein
MVAVLVCAAVMQAATSTLSVGTRVEFDKVYASNPALSQWVEGEITGYMPAQNYYKIRSTSGINYTIPNDPRWVRTAGASSAVTAPGQGTEKAPPPGTEPPQPVAPQEPSAPAGAYAVGTRAQFDRVEATVPAHGRWDSGVIIERAANNRYKIRGDNGIIYTIRNGRRWILPAGAPLPGPRHDYLNTPPPAAPGGNADTPAANAGAMPPDGIYNVTNLGDLHVVGVLQIRGASYRGLEAAGPFKARGGNGAALDFTGGLAGL